VLPLTAANIRAVTTLNIVHAITTADIGVAVEVVIHVDVDVTASPAATPSPATAPRSAHGHTNAK
jgi:hypothetical protein